MRARSRTTLSNDGGARFSGIALRRESDAMTSVTHAMDFGSDTTRPTSHAMRLTNSATLLGDDAMQLAAVRFPVVEVAKQIIE